jgi:hypothetical protein
VLTIRAANKGGAAEDGVGERDSGDGGTMMAIMAAMEHGGKGCGVTGRTGRFGERWEKGPPMVANRAKLPPGGILVILLACSR